MSASCPNCDAPLEENYCAQCGQSAGTIDLPVGEFARDFASEALGLDSRVRHTLWPLVRSPGRVAREYVEGRRARFVPPIRLYLLTSFMMFVLLSFGELDVNRVDVDGRQVSQPGLLTTPDSTAESTAPVDSVPLSEDEAEPTSSTPDSGMAVDAAVELDTVILSDSAAASDSVPASDSTVSSDTTIVMTGPGWSLNLGTDELNDRLAAGFQRLMQDQRGFTQTFVDLLARAMIVLLPFFALLLKMMWRKRWYVHHMVFAMYFHSFAFGVIALTSLPDLIGATAVASVMDVLILAIPIHLFLATRRFYGPGWSVYPKTFLVLMTYALIGTLVVLGLLIYSVLAL
ncbi:MAG: DUF3667 domain-containing protein [Gemmatimonadota bacterium]